MARKKKNEFSTIKFNKMNLVPQPIDDGFKCNGCSHDVPSYFSIKTANYCYLCDPAVTVQELLDDYDARTTQPTENPLTIPAEQFWMGQAQI